jgi:hypothetical protein
MDETMFNQDAILEEFEKTLKRAAATAADGLKANSRGKLMGLLMKLVCGAESPKGRGDNLATIDGAPTRFHAADGTGFTLNEKVEPTVLVFLSYKGKPTADKPLLGKIYGLRLADCLQVGKKVKGNGTERVSVSLARVKRVPLGVAVFPARWTEAESVQHRMELEDGIEKLTAEELATMMSARTRENIRTFVVAGREERRRQQIWSPHRRSQRWRKPPSRSAAVNWTKRRERRRLNPRQRRGSSIASRCVTAPVSTYHKTRGETLWDLTLMLGRT